MKRNMITVVYPWYANVPMAAYQINSWNKLPEDLKKQIHFILIDDGSPQGIEDVDVQLNLTMARIKHDIPWNQPGARNLGAYLADTEYLLFTDIDHELSESLLNKTINKQKESDKVYMFLRMLQGKPYRPHPCSFLISKVNFNLLGGFDEDFSGHYGHDDSLLVYLIDKYYKREIIDDYLLLHENGKTSCLERNHSFNAQLLKNKIASIDQGTYHNSRRLRFDWEVTCRYNM